MNLKFDASETTGTNNKGVFSIAAGSTDVIEVPYQSDDVVIRRNTTFADNSNVTISGNLTVQGSQTTITSTQLAVGDNVITLNDDFVAQTAPTGVAGVEVNRGKTGSDNSVNKAKASFVFNETTLCWESVIPDSNDVDETSTTTSKVLTVANITAETFDIDGGSF